MYYSAIVLHEDAQPHIDFQVLSQTQAFPFRSNTCANPRRNLQNSFEIKQHKSDQNTNINEQFYRPAKSIRDQLIQKTNRILYNRRKKLMVKMIEQPTKKGANKVNKFQRSNQKAYSVGKMTHSYFFGHDRHLKTNSKMQTTLPQTPFGKDQFSMSVHKLNPQRNSKSKLQDRQQSKRKSVEKIVQKLRSRNNESQILSVQSNNRTYQKQQKSEECFSPLPEKRKVNIDVVPTVMNLRSRRMINMERRNKISNPLIDYSRRDLRHARSQKPQSQQIKRPNTSTSIYRKNSGGWNGQDNLAPW